jgi:hypothetical protein
MKKISRARDLAFKKAFSTTGHTDALIGLAKDILDLDIDTLDIEEPYSISTYVKLIDNKEYSQLQQTIKDVSAVVTIKDKLANLVSELQVKGALLFPERSLYYPADRYAKNYNVDGGKYQSLMPIYGIDILGFDMFKEDRDGVRQFEFWDRVHQKGFPVQFIVGYLEYKKDNFFTDNQRYWRDYFLDRDIPDDAPDYIKQAALVVEYANMNEEERRVLDLLEKFEADKQAREGFVYEEGKQDKAIEIAINSLKFGLPVETIIFLTGLSEDEILALKDNSTANVI